MVSKLSSLRQSRARSVGFALIGIMGFLIAGFVFQPAISSIPLIAPQVDLDDQLQIPFITPQDQKKNDEILKEIEEVIKDPAITPPEYPNIIGNLTKDIVDFPEITNDTSIICTDGSQPSCTPVPVVTSEDPPLTQIGDIVDDNPILEPILPNSPSLELITKITKQDSNGNRQVIEKITQFAQLAFLVEKDTNVDYTKGFLEIELFVKGESGKRYTGSGTFDIKVGGTSIFTTPTQISFDAVADQQGRIPISVISPTGAKSNVFTFDFNANINKFPFGRDTTIDLIINSLTAKDNGNNFSIQNVSVFKMDLTRDEFQIIITDEQGVTQRVYPTDSKIILTTVGKTVNGGSCIIGVFSQAGSAGKTSGSSLADCLLNFPPAGCTTSSCINGWKTQYPISPFTHGTAPAPSMTGITLMDSTGKLIFSRNGGTGKIIDDLVTRNQNYTLKFSSPVITSNLSFGKAQQTQSYSCSYEGLPLWTVSVYTQPAQSGCGFTNTCFSTTYYSLVPNGINLGKIQCNLPK